MTQKEMIATFCRMERIVIANIRGKYSGDR